VHTFRAGISGLFVLEGANSRFAARIHPSATVRPGTDRRARGGLRGACVSTEVPATGKHVERAGDFRSGFFGVGWGVVVCFDGVLGGVGKWLICNSVPSQGF